VIGIGGLGHMALKFLNAWGCEVTAFTSTASKKKEVLSLGAHHMSNSRDENEIKSAAGRFDYILSTVAKMLDFANLHQIKPEIEKFKFTDINKAIERLRSGEARYRVVLCR